MGGGDCTSQNLVVALSTQAVADPKFGPTYPSNRTPSIASTSVRRLRRSRMARRRRRSISSLSPFDNNASCPAPEPPCQTFPNGTTVDGLATQGTVDATPNDPMITTGGFDFGLSEPARGPVLFRSLRRFRGWGMIVGSRDSSFIVCRGPLQSGAPARVPLRKRRGAFRITI
jgi:hypothetical protein